MINLINDAINKKLNNLSSTTVVNGIVESTDPLLIRLNSKLVIGPDFIEPRSLGIDDSSPSPALPFVIGEKISMIRYNDGQRFYVIPSTKSITELLGQLADAVEAITDIEEEISDIEEEIAGLTFDGLLAQGNLPSGSGANAYWQALEMGIYKASDTTVLSGADSSGKPSTWGLVEVIKSGTEVSVVWHQQPTGNIFRMSMNANTVLSATSWRTLIDNNGGTFTNKITMPANKYHSAQEAPLDMNNSDIVNANCIFFGDESTDNEGLNFLKQGGDKAVLADYETLRAYRGKVYFAGENIALHAYPVGSIYMSVLNTSPATLFGGTWVQLKDRFLLGAGDVYTNGNTGGAATHALSSGEIAAHTHDLANHTHGLGGHTHWVEGNTAAGGEHSHYIRNTAGTGSGAGPLLESYSNPGEGWRECYTNAGGSHGHWWGATTGGPSTGSNGPSNNTSGSAGSGSAHNNMPPYLIVYMWKRTV